MMVEQFDLLAPPPAELYKDMSNIELINLDKMRFLGDGLWALYVSATTLFPPRPPHLQAKEQSFFWRAETQSVFLDRLMAAPSLNDKERQLAERCLNNQNFLLHAPQRFRSPENCSIYLKAATLESMLGYWYQLNPVRLQQMMEWLGMGKIDKLRESIPLKDLWRAELRHKSKFSPEVRPLRRMEPKRQDNQQHAF